MRFALTQDGTVTDCREALNNVLATFTAPETQEQKVIRMIAHYLVADYLDPLHNEWQQRVNALRSAKLAEPPEPKASIAIDCMITFGGKA